MMVLLKKDLRLFMAPGIALLMLMLFLEIYGFFLIGLGEWDLSRQDKAIEEDGMGTGILLLIMISICVPRMMFQDLDGGQLYFLDQFPLSRFRLFLSRYTSFVVWMMGSLLLMIIMRGFIIEWHSVDSPIIETWRYCLYQWSAQLYFVMMVTPIMGVLSLLRQAYPWLSFALIFFSVIMLTLNDTIPVEARVEMVKYNALAASYVLFIEDKAIWATEPALWLGGLGILCFCICIRAYQCLGRPIRSQWLSNILKTRWATVMIVCVVCFIGFLMVINEESKVSQWEVENASIFKDEMADYGVDKTLLEIRAGDFIWLIQERDRETFQEVIDQSPTIYRDLLSEFKVKHKSLLQPIIVVPSDRIPKHAGGVANWRRIRLARFLSGEKLIQVFRHELTHVLIEIWSKSALRMHFNSTQTFHEGTAQWSEGLSKEEKELVNLKSILQHQWDSFDLDELFDGESLTEERGLEMIYTFGHLFVEAIMEASSENQLAKITLSFSEYKDSELTGIDLWQRVFQKTGVSLENVRIKFGQSLQAKSVRDKEFVKSLPKPEAKLIQNDKGEFILTPSVETNYIGAKMILDVEPLLGSPHIIRSNENDEFVIPQHFVDHEILSCRLGWAVPDWRESNESSRKIKFWSSLSEIKVTK